MYYLVELTLEVGTEKFMSNTYNPRQYWEQRLNSNFTLKGVGHIGFSESYNNWLYRRKELCIDSCLSGTSLQGKNVLDIGCGTGFFVNWYIGKGANITGIDITDVSIEKLKQKYEGEFYTQDITDSSFSLFNKKFDIVNIWDVVYHIVDPNLFNQALDNIVKSIKDGGLLLLTDWFGASSDNRIGNHVQGRCLDTYNKILPNKGFELVGIYPLYYHLNNVHVRILDNYLGKLYFELDNRNQKIPKNNLSLGLWRYNQKNVQS